MIQTLFAWTEADAMLGRTVRARLDFHSLGFGPDGTCGVRKGTVGKVVDKVKAFTASFGLPEAVYRLEVEFSGGARQVFDRREYRTFLEEVPGTALR